VHQATQQVLQWFDSSHLPEDLQKVVAPLQVAANEMVRLGVGPEMTAGLRKLLEAKDCFVRAAIQKKKDSGA
jgi:hypothetical protein